MQPWSSAERMKPQTKRASLSCRYASEYSNPPCSPSVSTIGSSNAMSRADRSLGLRVKNTPMAQYSQAPSQSLKRLCRNLRATEVKKRISCTVLGYARSSRLRAWHSLLTSLNSYVSRYLMPPHARFDDCCEVSEAKSPQSISATRTPRAANAAAETAPLMPPPRTSTSNRRDPSFSTFVSRSEGAGWLMRPTIYRTFPRRVRLAPMLLSQAHRDEQVCVDVDVVVSVDGDGDGDVAVGGSDHRHNRVSIPTIRSRRSSPRCFVVASTAFSTNNASSTAAHSIADPRAMA